MNYQVPHSVEKVVKLSASRKNSFNFRKANEKRVAVEVDITCPRISWNSDGDLILLEPTTSDGQLSLNLPNHFTSLPLPLFQPTQVKCGIAPNYEPGFQDALHPNQELLKSFVAYEIIFEERNIRNRNLKAIQADFEKSKIKQRIPLDLRKFKLILGKYGIDEGPVTKSWAGGNLGTLYLDRERFLLSTSIDPDRARDRALCLTRMTAEDMKDQPMDIGLKVPLGEGEIYQVAVSRKPINSGEPRLFATRQQYSTRLWKAHKRNELGGRPAMTLLHEWTDINSSVKSVDISHVIDGEFCELRSKHVTVVRNDKKHYQQEINKAYNSCLYESHPLNLLLASNTSVDLLDTRRGYIQPIFSIDNQRLYTNYGLPEGENILSFTHGSRKNITYMATESSVLVWDNRFGNKPLANTRHLMEEDPTWISIVDVGCGREWVSLDSRSPNSSCTMGFSWSEVPVIHLSSMMSTFNPTNPAPVIEIEPRARPTLDNTSDYLFSRFVGKSMDWSIQNRLCQYRSGVTCDKDDDGTINIWQCNTSGDIFLQQLNINRSMNTHRASMEVLINRAEDWIKQVDEIEKRNRTRLSSKLQTESFDEINLEQSELEVEYDANQLSEAPILPSSEQQLEHPKYSVYDSSWRENSTSQEEIPQFTEPGPSFGSTIPKTGYLPFDLTITEDFDHDLISSTPLNARTSQPNNNFLKPSTSTQKRKR